MVNSPQSENTAVGIDLGTSSTVIALETDGKVALLTDSHGRELFPSVVSYLSDGRILTGVAAKNRAAIAPESTVTSVKRLIGRSIEEVERYKLRQRYAIPIVQSSAGGILLNVGDRQLSPIDVEAEILKAVRDIGSVCIGRSISRAVITVPASFQHAHREATIEAARRAGIETLRLLNEPTAAALSYGRHHEANETLVVYDFGGGTFDVTVLERNNSFYEVRATAGRPYLGGDDFDFEIASDIVERLESSHGIRVRQDMRHKLLPAAERIKIELSQSTQTSAGISTRWLGSVENETIDMYMSRSQLESLIRPIIIETLEAVDSVLAAAHKRISDVSRVLLVGGSTRVPLVRRMVTAYFGREPEQRVSPETAVALGAAHYAALLAGARRRSPRLPTQTKLVEVVPAALSVETIGGLCETVVEQNARLPATRSREYTTSSDGQTLARIRIFQGDARRSSANELLGEVVLDRIPAAERGQSRIEVTFEVNPNGILEVSAREKNSGLACNARLLLNNSKS